MKSDQHITEIIRLASILSVALPFAIYLIKIRYASIHTHLIGILTMVSAASDFAAFFLFKSGQSTVSLFNGYYIVLFLILAWFYYLILESKNGRKIVTAGIVIYGICLTLITIYVQGFSQYQTFLWTVTGMIMIIFSIAYFLHIFSAQHTMNNLGLLWVNSGVLLYFSMNLFLFVMSSYVLTKLDSQISLLIWSFHNVNNILRNLLFAFGIYAFSAYTSRQEDLIAQRK